VTSGSAGTVCLILVFFKTPFVAGKKHGTQSFHGGEMLPNGQYFVWGDAQYRNGRLDGVQHTYVPLETTFSTYAPNPSQPDPDAPGSSFLHGPYVEHGDAFDLEPESYTYGQYALGQKCGIWTYIPFLYVNDAGELVSTVDYGPGGVLPNPSPYPPPNPNEREIRGQITDREDGLKVGFAVVTAGSYETISSSSGAYSLTVGSADWYDVTWSKDRYVTARQMVHMDKVQSKTVNVSMVLSNSATRPVITAVLPKDLGVYIGGTPATRDYDVSVDWAGGQPGYVVFNANGAISLVDANERTAWKTYNKTYNMGTDFIPTLDCKVNSIQIKAVGLDGQKSKVVFIYPVVVPPPSWAEWGPFKLIMDSYNYPTFTLSGSYPVEPLKVGVNPESLGPILWKAWGLFPFLGGCNFELKKTQASLAIDIDPAQGNGSVTVTGTTGFAAAGQEIMGTVGGKGSVQYVPGQGLEWNGASFLVGVEGRFTKEVGPVTVIPALTSAVNWPVVGRAITWVNDTAKIKGYVGPNFGLDFTLISSKETGYMTFKESHFSFGGVIGAEMEIPAHEKLKFKLDGNGTIKVYFQVPANPDYYEKVEAQFSARLDVTVWVVTSSFNHSHTFPTAEGAAALSCRSEQSLATIPKTDGFQLIDRGFLNTPRYSVFVAGAEGRAVTSLQAQPAVASHQVVIENIYPESEPVIALKGTNSAMAYVHFNPAISNTLQATDIRMIYHNGAAYLAPQSIRADTQAEFAPSIAFDASNRLVCVWERVADTNLVAEENLVWHLAREMEIVWAAYDPAAAVWSEPAALTDNTYLDYRPILKRGASNELMLVWFSNASNELAGVEGAPTKIHSAIWNPVSATFAAPVTLAPDFVNCSSFSFDYSGTEATLAYAKDMDGIIYTTNETDTALDQEIFYNRYDGTNWGSSVRLTDNATPDGAPNVCYLSSGEPAIVWRSGSDLVRLTNWTTRTTSIIRTNSGAAAFGAMKMVRDAADRLVLLWQDRSPEGIDLFYKVYDAPMGSWSEDRQLTADAALEKDFDVCFAQDGRLEGVYNRVLAGSESNSLFRFTHALQTGLALANDALRIDPVKAAPGTNAVLYATVSNDGDLAVTSPQVAFYLGDPDHGGTLIGTASHPGTLPGGSSSTLSVLWTVPASETGYRVYAKADPSNVVVEQDETNNTAWLDAAKPDLAAVGCWISARDDAQHSVDLIARVWNNNAIAVTGTVAVTFVAVSNTMVHTVELPGILANSSVDVAWQVWPANDFVGGRVQVRVTVDPENLIDETDEGNNSFSFNAQACEDSDGDGMNDAWEFQHFGSLAKDGTDDSDGDGDSDMDEYLHGTDPRDAGQVFRPRLDVQPSETSVSWDTVTGRRYSLYTTTNLLSDWEWVKVLDEAGNLNPLSYTNGPGSKRFYKIKVVSEE